MTTRVSDNTQKCVPAPDWPHFKRLNVCLRCGGTFLFVELTPYLITKQGWEISLDLNSRSR